MPARPAMSGTVYGVILNDICTVQRMGQSLDDAPYKGAPKAPVLYIKPAGTRVPGGSMVSLPEGAAAVEVGATVGLVMGQAAARLSVETALEAVAGVVLAADLSLPHASYYRPAVREKCFDGALPLGPVQPLSDLASLSLTTRIDGVVVEERSLADLLRDPARLLADVTGFMTLAEGDVLLVGVSYMAPQAVAGSRVSIDAGALGTLEFSIAGAQA
jgi:5-oxopent-3-ene-1,2,5-tricarboxylate decarboxylase/2-hydroxyhepta-2,4-diene-1,7-dioate isomerase